LSEPPQVAPQPSGDPDESEVAPEPATAQAPEPATTGSPLAAVIDVVREVGLVLVIALGLSLLIKTLLVQAFFIPSPSMNNTLLTGDRVLVNKLTPGPFSLHHGDVIVFSDPGGWLDPTVKTPEGPVQNAVRSTLTFVGLLPNDSDEHLIKRVIGLPGDRVACSGSDGKVTVNGKAIDEPYIYPGDDPSDKAFSVTVPAGHLWVMGDHRSVSEDSRYHPTLDNGMVPIKDVVGKAFIKVWPTSRFGLLHNPTGTFATVPAP
jgi:signal peptidase I